MSVWEINNKIPKCRKICRNNGTNLLAPVEEEKNNDELFFLRQYGLCDWLPGSGGLWGCPGTPGAGHGSCWPTPGQTWCRVHRWSDTYPVSDERTACAPKIAIMWENAFRRVAGHKIVGKRGGGDEQARYKLLLTVLWIRSMFCTRSWMGQHWRSAIFRSFILRSEILSSICGYWPSINILRKDFTSGYYFTFSYYLT